MIAAALVENADRSLANPRGAGLKRAGLQVVDAVGERGLATCERIADLTKTAPEIQSPTDGVLCVDAVLGKDAQATAAQRHVACHC